jgi:polysaccharide biosynthesis protein PelG
LAGIGLTLERLTSRGSIAGTVQALAYCCVVSCGPWLFTITCLGAMTWFAARYYDENSIPIFGNIVIYNFAFSLVLLGPLTLICTRYLADCLYTRSLSTLNGVCVGALTIGYGMSIAVAAPFYFLITDIGFDLAIAATLNFVLVSMLWLTLTFMHAIKNFSAFLITFAVGMMVAFLSGALLLPHMGPIGLLWGLNAGLFIIVFVAIGITISQYPYDVEKPFAFVPYFRKHWDLALTGIIYNMAIWIDKWVMWFSADNVVVAEYIVFNPTYDFPMFLAYLAIIPSLSLLMLHTETGYLREYNSYYREIEGHAPFSWIAGRCQKMVDCLLISLKDIVILQASLTLCALALSPFIIELSGGEFRQLAIFRLGLLAAFLQLIFIFVTMQLYYFDLRRLNLCLQGVFLLCNGISSYVTASFGFAYYGYGYFASSLLCSGLSLVVLGHVLKRLPYITFVSNNPSVR